MHTFEGLYGENDCLIRIKGNREEPFILVNLEILYELIKNSSLISENLCKGKRCDCIYITKNSEDRKLYIYILEFKNDIPDKTNKGISDIREKFTSTEECLKEILKNLNLPDNGYTIKRRIFVASEKLYNRVNAIWTRVTKKPYIEIRKSGEELFT